MREFSMERKAVFFDIDGTLWNKKCEIQPSTIEAIRSLRANGHLAFICSGRSRSNIRNERLLGIGFDGVVAGCGTHIDFGEETVFTKLMTEEQMTHILATAKKHEMPLVLEGPQYIYVNDNDFHDDPFVVYLRKELGDAVKNIPEEVSEIIMNKFSGELADFDMEAYEKDLGEEFDLITHTGDPVFEVVPHGFNKATGIKKVCELMGISLQDTYAFGDSENDLEMIEFVAHGIVMGNGTEAVKAVADYITTDVDEDGIANGLKHYGLI